MTRRVLSLVGATTDQAMCDLSELYARGCVDALGGASYEFVHCHVSPDGAWRFPKSLDADDIAGAPIMSAAAGIARMATLGADLALPQMFCMAGMTTYRALLEVLGLPYLGNRPLQMALAADKAKARAIVAAAGVAVPEAELLRHGDAPKLAPPVVVKPNAADNSDGVSLVRSADGYQAALAAAFAHDDTVLVERYVALGREVRCGIVVRDGVPMCLPLEEYRVDSETRPIRARADKLRRDGAGALFLAAKQESVAWIVDADDPVVRAVNEAARRAHVALGCRQYSLFDFRIDPDGKPWFLEAGLYCSYSPQSVVVAMAQAGGTSLADLFDRAVEELIG